MKKRYLAESMSFILPLVQGIVKLTIVVGLAWLFCRVPYRPFSLILLLLPLSLGWLKYRNRYSINVIDKSCHHTRPFISYDNFVFLAVELALLFMMALVLAIITPLEFHW